MKNRVLKLFAGALLFLLLAGPAAAQSRLGTVDLQKIFDGYWRRKQADSALKEHIADLEKEDKGLRDEYKKSTDEYQKLRDEANDQAVSLEEREKRKKASEAKLKDIKETEETLRQYEAQARTRIEEQRRRMRDKVLEEIRTAITAKAKSAGYALVIDVSAKSGNSTVELISMAMNRADPSEEMAKTTPVVLYNSGENDLTATVLEQLNAGAPVDATKPTEKKDEKKSDKK